MKKIIYLLFMSLFVFTSCNQEDDNIDLTMKKGKQDKVTVCHKGKAITINENSLKAHLNHGDVLGDCTPQIGDFYQGGVVYYILQPEDLGYVEGETHGLIATTINLEMLR